MNPIPPGVHRAPSSRGSLLLASCASRVLIALLAVAVIWAGTSWALGWW